MKRKIFNTIFAVALTLVCVLAIPAGSTAFAAEVTAPGTATTTVTYTVVSAYTVTIPETVAIGSSMTVSVADGALIDHDKEINVELTTCDFTLTNDDDNLTYTIKDGDTSITARATVLTYTAGTPGGATRSLAIALAEGAENVPIYSGNYTDTLTFTVTVDEAEPT